jgi:hypothetical protein
MNKKSGVMNACSPSSSLMAALSTFPTLSTLLMESLLELRSACSHYVGLETKVFSSLLFNVSLWFGPSQGVSLYPSLLPVLSSITRNNPEKVRDCVGIRDMIHLAKELVEFEVRIRWTTIFVSCFLPLTFCSAWW